MPISKDIYLGQQIINKTHKKVKEKFTNIDGEQYYVIENYKEISPFFMTLSSNSNHWMFISSTGGLTAGRVNSESAIFPYYTDDRITENHHNTGPKTVMLVTENNKRFLWEPFADEKNTVYDINSKLSKNILGNSLIFEEINESLGISFSYNWMNSKKFGWVRKVTLKNLSDENISIEIIDGLQNVIPAGTASQIQNTFGNLLNAYKKSEIDIKTGMGLFSLSATLTDLAEPSESLKTNTIWHTGINTSHYLLSTRQFDEFILGQPVESEREIKGERGCYFINAIVDLKGNEVKNWFFAADTDRDHSQVIALKDYLLHNSEELVSALNNDIQKGNRELISILSQNDGLQKTSNKMNCVHHEANVLFNIMRGGYFFNSYMISTSDFIDFLKKSNKGLGLKFEKKILSAGQNIIYNDFLKFILEQHDRDLERHWYEYLPLTFSRRHGDPSRPWNVFSIETEKNDGSPKLDYQGNWRDIFQNWEALTFSYPLYIKHIIGKFLNATTKDGYNPYRITKNGIDWEIPEPGNPWANIGYWSDHQIIYLLKLLEMYKLFYSEKITDELDKEVFTFANIPYEIKSFKEILKDPFQTIEFNEEKNEKIIKLTEEIGSEGKLLHDNTGDIFLGTMTEKLFILLLAKMGNYIPEGGIWMNTQRPEWNDANNALVGKGISVVTLAYIRRYVSFLIETYEKSEDKNFSFHSDTAQWFTSIAIILQNYSRELDNSHSSEEIFTIVESLGVASENYRKTLYNSELITKQTKISRKQILSFLKSTLLCVDDTLRKNKRSDGLFHSYNTLEIRENEMPIHNLYEMLEGQVAILSSGLLKADEAHRVLYALRNSLMFRKDQTSYMLYPNRELPGFLKKNNIDPQQAISFKLFSILIENGNRDLVTKDIHGVLHFNGSFNNVKQVRSALNNLRMQSEYKDLVEKEGKMIETLFESTFDHQSFTGRSGTFFGFEGLGSIYWHMVSKLLLAVQETLFQALENDESAELIQSLKDHYYFVRSGLGYNKSAKEYGAFPFDPYSHTHYGRGAKQPGMTGMVKEEVITRIAETGVRFKEGRIQFDSTLLDETEFLKNEEPWNTKTNTGSDLLLLLPKGSLGATICQTPYFIRKGEVSIISVYYRDGRKQVIKGNMLTSEISELIFTRNSIISHLEVVL